MTPIPENSLSLPPASLEMYPNAGSPFSRSRSTERRRDARYPTNDPAEVEVLHVNIQRLAARILDVSRSGLRVGIDERIGHRSQVKIRLPGQMVIFGEVRYCRCVGLGFHAGVLISQVLQAAEQSQEHVPDEELGLYLVGKGLTAAEILRLREHLIYCESCHLRLLRINAILNPVKKRRA
jgi:PilZ domain